MEDENINQPAPLLLDDGPDENPIDAPIEGDASDLNREKKKKKKKDKKLKIKGDLFEGDDMNVPADG